ncbi:MAG: c-type cytochrome [Saprospiraceae bacterium]
MKKFLKWTGFIVLGLILIVMLMAFIFSKKFNNEFEKVVVFDPTPVTIFKDSTSLERGRVLSVGCRSCHGVDLAGTVFFDDPTIGTLPSSNLTRAIGSETEGYTSIDYVRAIRHGLNKSGHKLMIMPCKSYSYMSDEDLGCLIGFIESLEPIDKKFNKRMFTFMSQAMAGAGMFGDLFHYDIIDHEKAQNVPSPPRTDSLAYGSYLVHIQGCNDCHTKTLKGGPSPDPASPLVPDISSTSSSYKWTLEQFIQTFRTGTTPEGVALKSEFMPFSALGALDDKEIAAVYSYIHSLK